VCSQDKKLQQFGYEQRIHIGPVQFEAQQQTYVVRPEEGLSFPFHGFTWGMLGYGLCPCGRPSPSGELCVPVCAAGSPPCLKALCAKQSPVEPNVLWECVRENMTRCSELGPSDSWGLFPMDCSDQQCKSERAWAGNAYQDVTFEGIRLVTEGRSGLKLPNYKHVNATYHQAIHYGAQVLPPPAFSVAF
jgi:hypothetical protein